MTGISSSSAVIVARAALFDAFKTALAGRKVDVRFGSLNPVQHDDYAMLTGIRTATEPRGAGYADPRRQRQETITFRAEIGSWRAGRDDTAATRAFDDAFEMLRLIQDHIVKNDVTLGNTVMQCLPGDVDSEGIEDESESNPGFLVAIDAAFVCEHRVRPV